MDALHDMLVDKVEPRWREQVRQDYNSVWHDIPVDTDQEHYPDRPWQFYTDLDTIYAEIHDENGLQRQFHNIVTDYWDGDPDELAQETMHYLLFHELYHPLEAPSSNQDARKIHQAMRRGLLQAEPGLTPKEQVKKVRAAQNAVKDFILDNRFYIDNQEQGYVQEDVIPIWDVMELDGKDPRPDMYTITRVLYGALYGPVETHDFFNTKATSDGVAVAEETLAAVLDEEVTLPDTYTDPVDPDPLGEETAVDREDDASIDPREHLVDQVYDRFRHRATRYQAVEDMMAVLGPYVREDMPGARTDLDGVSTEQNVLEDLLDDMSPEEQDEFLDELMDGDEDRGSEHGGGDGMGNPDTDTDVARLQVGSYHEYYRDHHPRVRIRGGDKQGEAVEVGHREYLSVKRQQVVNQEQLAQLNLPAVARAQKRGLPAVMPMDDGLYRVYDYEINEEPVQDIRYRDESLSVPDIIEFYIDSSGSMFWDSGFKPGDGSRYDMLSQVLYGMVDALQQTEDALGTEVSVRIHNFASSQVSSRPVTVDEFWAGDTNVLNTLYRPDNGGKTTSLAIQRYDDDRDRTHVVISDGEMDNAAQHVSNMQDRWQDGEHTLMIEIGGTYNLGKQVEQVNLPYRQVHEKEEMLEEGLAVLLSP